MKITITGKKYRDSVDITLSTEMNDEMPMFNMFRGNIRYGKYKNNDDLILPDRVFSEQFPEITQGGLLFIQGSNRGITKHEGIFSHITYIRILQRIKSSIRRFNLSKHNTPFSVSYTQIENGTIIRIKEKK